MSASLIGRFGSSAFRLSSHSSVDVACGLVLLFGLGAKALPVWDSRMRGTIFGSALPSSDGRSKQTCDLTSSIVPQGTSFHRAVELAFSPIDCDLALSCCGSLLPAPAARCPQGAARPDRRAAPPCAGDRARRRGVPAADDGSRGRSGGGADLPCHRRCARPLPQLQGGRGGVGTDTLQA